MCAYDAKHLDGQIKISPVPTESYLMLAKVTHYTVHCTMLQCYNVKLARVILKLAR